MRHLGALPLSKLEPIVESIILVRAELCVALSTMVDHVQLSCLNGPLASIGPPSLLENGSLVVGLIDCVSKRSRLYDDSQTTQ